MAHHKVIITQAIVHPQQDLYLDLRRVAAVLRRTCCLKAVVILIMALKACMADTRQVLPGQAGEANPDHHHLIAVDHYPP
jgi:hypothetical protein